MLQITSSFDAGNIKVLSLDDPQDIQLEINKDNGSDFYQWFYFRLSNARGISCSMRIMNAGGAAYTDGWENYQAVASTDRENWERLETDYTDGVLNIHVVPEADTLWIAYFAPYSMERHGDLIANAQSSNRVHLSVLGQTLDGQDIDLLHFSDGSGGEKKKCWITARQHPGESMAEWCAEGLIGRLMDEADPIARELLKRADFYVVPNMNPDGSKRGHLRTNACGANLNREWDTPTMERSPEVFLVREKMHQTGVDFAIDMHGDEALPYNFIAGAEGTPDWSNARAAQLADYQQALVQASPDFQTTHGYPASPPGTANMSMATNWIAQEFTCLSMTLEMPFKDTVETPDETQGWSPERSAHLGRACLEALWARFGDL
jgi:murein tripeptide amidase MpaA